MYDKSIPCPVNGCGGQLIKQYHNGKKMHLEDLGDTAEVGQRHYVMCNRCGAKGISDSHTVVTKPKYEELDKLKTVHSKKMETEAEHYPLDNQFGLPLST